MESSINFAPPPPPPPIKGPLPTRRLESQIPAEAPACVQNAMMTKDKKPFTYTPGGIDLSQIKSPRMAKRVQKNALSEGVTGPPKVSPLAQQNQTQQKMPPQHMAKDVTGMPFQVFPTGPPAPPPPPTRQPPQQQQQQQQQHQENGTQNGNRQKSPKPQQHFEPPPMGFRPEIKIPQNPMANLKPTPRPQQNDDFWIEEYKSDKAAEPVLGAAPVTAPVAPKTPTTPQSPQTKPELDENKQDPSKHMSLHEKKGQLGQLYIPTPTEMDKQQLMNQQSPPWMSSNKAQANKDPAPEWVNSPQANSQQNNNQNERRIPIQFERTPTKTPGLTPMTPNLCPTPFYGAGKSPVSAAAVVNAFEPTFNSPQVYSPSVQYNPNQFVNQGYQNADYYQQQQQQQQQPRQVQTPQSAGPTGGVTRIIPIKLEGAQSPVTPNYRGPVSQSPIVVQSDPRQHQNWTNNPGGAPTQSRSFKVLQKITDAYSAADPADMSDTVPMQYQQAHYSKPMSPGADGQSDNVDTSMRRMKLNDEDQAFMNRVRNQVDDERYLHSVEDPRYRGSAIPSKAFKLLQNMTSNDNYDDQIGPANNRPRQGRPAQNRNEPDEDEAASKPYVPPSEQQVFEPKKYTGANIPSRSFRLLQAMTQPENVAEYAEYLQQLVRSESTDTNSSNLNNNENNNTLNNNNFTHFPFPPIPSNTNFPIPPNFSPFPIGTPFNFGGFIPPPAMPPPPLPPNFDPEMLMQFPQIPFPSFLPTPNVTGLNQHPNTENVQSNSSKEIPKPKLTEDLMNDLERLKDVELIDLLDDTTKSILDSLKSLQLQYGIHLDGLDEDECNKRAADLLKSDNKATLYSSLTNLLKRDCSSGSILSMHSLSERHPEESCELTEEKVNLIRSLSNLLKAEKCITETIQSQSRSRLNSFTTSEKSVRVRTISEGEKSGFDEKKIGDNLATPRASLTSIQSIEISSDSENNEAKSKTELNEQGSLQNTTEVQSEDKVCENDTNKNEEEEEEKNSESQNNQEEEEEEIDFWASIKSDDDILPPKRPLWSTRKSSFMQESTLEEVETETIEKTSQETSEVDNKNDLEMDNENESQINESKINEETTVHESDENNIQNEKEVEIHESENESKEGENPHDINPEQNNDSSHTLYNENLNSENHDQEVIQNQCNSPFPTESTMSLDIEQEIRDLHEYEAQHNLELPLDDIAPPEDFQDQNTPTAENQPDSISVTSNQSQSSNMNPEQYAMMLQAMYHNYYTNPANSALLANPVYYQQYLAYQQYLQNMYYQQQQQQQQQHHHQSQTMSSNYPENDQEGDFEEEEEYCDQSEASEWYDMSQQEQHPGFVNHQESHYDNFQESSNEVQNQSHDSGHQISENHFDYATNSNQNCHDDGNEEEHQADEQDNENYIQSQNDILPENEIETKNLEEDHCAYNASPVEVPEIKVNALDSETIAQLQQNIDLVVEDHTELLEDEAIVEGKMLIIPSEIVTGDTSLSQDDELSTSCTVVTATTIEKRPYEYNKTQSNSENSSKSEQIVVYEIDDQSPTVSIDRQEGNTSECESMGEEEQEIESLHNSEMIEEDPSEECSDVEEGECDEISPLTYFKNNVNEHLPHQLSVIFEASEYSERASVRSSSVDSESEISHEITETQRNGKMCEDNEDSESEDVKVSISLPLKKPEVKEEPTITDDVVSVVVNLTPKGPSLERTFSGSRHNSIIDDNDSDVLVSVSLPLKRNKFSSQSLNVACEDINEENEHENVDVNESFDAYESFDMDEEHPPPIVHEPVKKVLEKQKSIEVEVQHQEMQPLHPMTYTTDDNTDTDSNMGDNEYETSAQSSSTMINEQSLTALSNLNNFMNFNQTFSRASSVPPCLSSTTTDSNKTDEAIQRRFQTLREQWGQLVKANNEDNDKSNEKAGSSWKITFFDDNQDWFNRRVESEDREVTPSRPQSCLPIQCNKFDNDFMQPEEQHKTSMNWSPKKKTPEVRKNSPEHKENDENQNWWPRKRVTRKDETQNIVNSHPETESNSESGANENWWPKKKITNKKRSPEPEKENINSESDNADTSQNWWPKRRVSPKKKSPEIQNTPSKVTSNNIESDESSGNWWPKRKVNTILPEDKSPKNINQSPPKTVNSEKTPLKYRMVQVQALDSDESESMGDSASDDDEEDEFRESGTSHNSLSESNSSSSWKKSSSKTLKSNPVQSSSSNTTNNYHSASETTSDYEMRARSCPRQSVLVSDRSSSVVREPMPHVTSRPPRPGSVTRELETKSENIRFIRASSVTRESSLSRQNSQLFITKDVRSPKFGKEGNKFNYDQFNTENGMEKSWEEYIPPRNDRSPLNEWISAQTLAFPGISNEKQLQTPPPTPPKPRQYRSMSVAREIPSPKNVPIRPSSCTREMETLRPEKKTSSLYRQLSINVESDAFRSARSSPCSFSTHPERPASCTLELDLNKNTVLLPFGQPEIVINNISDDLRQRRESTDTITDNTLVDEPVEPPVVMRRRVKRNPRPVSCAGELEKQSYRNSLEGSRMEALSECQVLPTLIEIHHTQPARPSSCTRELESSWSNTKSRNKQTTTQRPRTRAHSVTREITLCTSPSPSVHSTHSDGNATNERRRMSVRERVNAIEEFNLYSQVNSQNACPGAQGRDPSVKSSIDESEADDDSGVQSSKYVSEVETDNEGFSELRKMTPYQRANTQTKLYQYLQECVSEEQEDELKLHETEEVVPVVEKTPVQETKPTKKKIIHNVSATRRQNPEKIKEAETPQQRRQRLSLPLVHQHSSGIESVDSSVASPSSPVREKLVNELVQSLLMKKDGKQFRNIPLEKLHAAALKILEEEQDQSHAPASTVYSTPALTPSEFQLDSPCSYEEYHASWQPADQKPCEDNYDYSVFPSKTFKKLHDQVCGGGGRATSPSPNVSIGNRRGSLPRSPLTRSTHNNDPYSHSHSPSPFN